MAARQPQQTRDIMAELGVARCRGILRNLADEGKIRYERPTGCWSCTLAPGANGYISIKRVSNEQIRNAEAAGRSINQMYGKNAGFHYYLHRIAFVAFHGRNMEEGKESSHVCANEVCFRLHHILEETGQQNHERSVCPRPGLLDNSGHLILLDRTSHRRCTHTPQCFPNRHITLQCPHSAFPPEPTWGNQLTQHITVQQWLSGAPPEPLAAGVQRALDAGLFSDASSDNDDESAARASPLQIPSSPPQYTGRSQLPTHGHSRSITMTSPGQSPSGSPIPSYRRHSSQFQHARQPSQPSHITLSSDSSLPIRPRTSSGPQSDRSVIPDSMPPMPPPSSDSSQPVRDPGRRRSGNPNDPQNQNDRRRSGGQR